MNCSYFFRWPLILFLVGLAISLISALCKVRHWPRADEMITIGNIMSVAALLFAVIKLLRLKKPQ